MITVTLKKVDPQDFLILQNAVTQLRLKTLNKLQNTPVNGAYFNNVLIVDVTTSLFFKLRNKIENQTKLVSNLKLKIYEAIVLLECCIDNDSGNVHEGAVRIKYLNEIHKQITNL